MNAQPLRRTRLLLPALLLAGGTLAACGTSGTTAHDPEPSITTPAAQTSAAAPTDTSSPSSTPATVQVPVYFVMATPEGQRLVEEMHAVPADAPLRGALAALAAPTDPDYRSYYAAGDLADPSYDGNGFTVTLANTALEDRGNLSKDDAVIAVQQLAYTLDAVQESQGAPTTVTAGGKAVSLYGVDTHGGIALGDPIGTLALVNVLAPASSDKVSGTLEASGMASSFEGTVPWTIADASGKVVKKGFATAEGWMDQLYPWKKSIDVSSLDPGQYVFTASTDDPSGGAEGNGPTKDTKVFTIS